MKHQSRLARIATAATTLAITVAGATVVLGSSPAEAALSETQYGFSTWGLGSRVKTGPVGLTSSPTALSFIGCTRLAGKENNEKVASVDAPAESAALHIGAVTSHSETFREGKNVGTLSTNKIANVKIGPADGPHLELTGLQTTAKVWADKNGNFHEDATYKLADLVAETGTPLDDVLNGLTGPLFKALSELLKSQDGHITIPGLARITLGRTKNKDRGSYAISNATALRITVFAAEGDDINVTLGRSHATINRKVAGGVMSGQGFAAQVDVLDGVVGVGRLARQPLPCKGTGGEVIRRAVAGLDLGNAGVLGLGAAFSEVYGVQGAGGSAKAWTAGQIADVSLGSGDTALVISGIRGQANVIKKKSGKLIRNTKGSKILSISIGGEPQDIPLPGDTIEIPGLAKVEFFITEHPGKRSIKVTAVRITLLPDAVEDTGLVTIDLGVAQTSVKKF